MGITIELNTAAHHLTLVLAHELLLELAGQLLGQGQLVRRLGRAANSGLHRVGTYRNVTPN